jgi:uncharacterized protein YndB with AHSA1/START domain
MKTGSNTAASPPLASSETTGQPFIITRTFNAPSRRVWKAWTEPEGLRQWFGPKGSTITEIKMELKPGGTCHCCIRSPGGPEMWGKFIYREVAAPERLVYAQHFSDRAGGITRHPGSPTWPLQMLTTVTFAGQNGKTALTVRWAPLNPTEDERKTFDSAHEVMNQGWGGSFDQLTDYLAR